MKNDILFLYVIVLLAIIVFGGLSVYSFILVGRHSAPTTTTTVTNTQQLTISASGTVYNRSTQSDLYVTVNATGLTNAAAVQNISLTLDKFNSTILKYVDGNLSRVTTSYFQVYKLYNKTGYQATESLTVTIPQIANTSAAINALSNISDVYVGSAQPQLSDAQISIMRVNALADAMANATSQAHALVGNSSLQVLNITLNNYRIYPIEGAGAVSSPGASGGAPSSAPVNITPQFYGGTNQVTESVTVVFGWTPNK